MQQVILQLEMLCSVYRSLELSLFQEIQMLYKTKEEKCSHDKTTSSIQNVQIKSYITSSYKLKGCVYRSSELSLFPEMKDKSYKCCMKQWKKSVHTIKQQVLYKLLYRLNMLSSYLCNGIQLNVKCRDISKTSFAGSVRQ